MAIHSTANVHDSKVLEEAVDAISPIRKPSGGRLRKRPKKLHADNKAYDFPRCREALRKRRATVLAAHAGHVDSIFVSGKALKRDGKLVDVDAERVRRLAGESRDHLFEQAGLFSTEAK